MAATKLCILGVLLVLEAAGVLSERSCTDHAGRAGSCVHYSLCPELQEVRDRYHQSGDPADKAILDASRCDPDPQNDQFVCCPTPPGHGAFSTASPPHGSFPGGPGGTQDMGSCTDYKGAQGLCVHHNDCPELLPVLHRYQQHQHSQEDEQILQRSQCIQTHKQDFYLCCPGQGHSGATASQRNFWSFVGGKTASFSAGGVTLGALLSFGLLF